RARSPRTLAGLDLRGRPQPGAGRRDDPTGTTGRRHGSRHHDAAGTSARPAAAARRPPAPQRLKAHDASHGGAMTSGTTGATWQTALWRSGQKPVPPPRPLPPRPAPPMLFGYLPPTADKLA